MNVHLALVVPILLADGGIGILVSLALTVALSAASYFLSASARGPKPRAIFTPTTLANRGAAIPLLVGRARVGPVFCWAGSRYTMTEKAGGGGGGLFGKGSKSSGGGGTLVYYEAGWHVLGVGRGGLMAAPGRTILRRIWQEGKVIWSGEINAVDDPSGATFTADDGSEFTIYWGELDQPISTVLADASRVGIASRWPSVVHVVWTNKRLGSSPRWPQIEYDLEVAPVTAVLEAAYPGLVVAVEPWKDFGDYVGPNAAWVMAQILFESYPHGVGLPHEHFSIFDGVLVSGSGFGTPVGQSGSLVTQTTDIPYGPGLMFDSSDDFGSATALPAGWYDLFAWQDAGATVDGVGRFGFKLSSPGTGGHFALDTFYVRLRGATSGRVIDLLPEGALAGFPGLLALGVTSGAWTGSAFPGFTFPGTWTWVPLTRYHYLENESWFFEWGITWSSDNGGGAGYPPQWLVATIGDHTNPAPKVRLIVDPVVTSGGSFATLAALMDAEGQAASLLAAEGEEADAAVAKLLQDMGALWVRDHEREGKNAWRAVREESPLALPTELLLPTEVETEVLHAERGVDRASFTFRDVDEAFRDNVISIDEDGQPLLTNNVRARKIELPTVIHLAVASAVAERRSQEELAGGAKFTVFAGRDARTLTPGRAIAHPEIPIALRLTDVALKEDAARVELTLIADHYGAAIAAYVHPATPGPAGDTSSPADNERWAVLEVSGFLVERGVPMILPLRVRANARMTLQVIHLSADGTTYTEVNRDLAVMAGGVLTEGLAATGPWRDESGPAFDAEGEDLLQVVEDLTADPASWCAGRQLAVIGSEVFHLRNVEALGGASYRLRGLQRARYDSERAAHSIGAAVFVFRFDDADPLWDVLLAPGATVHVKQQPAGGGPGALPIGSVTATTLTLEGKGIVPMRPGRLRVLEPAPGVWRYRTGEDVRVRWAYRSVLTPNTGAGMQGAGLVSGRSEVEGTFELTVLTLADAVVHTVGTATPDVTLANADLVTWLGSEQSFKLELRHVTGGFRSASRTATVTLA